MRSFLCFRFFLFWTKCSWSTRVCTLRCGLSLFFLFPFYLWYATLFFFSMLVSFFFLFFFFHCDENESVHFCTADETLCSASMIALQRNYKDEYIYIYAVLLIRVYLCAVFFFLICACAHGIWKLRFSFFFFSLLCDSLCYIGPIELFLVFAGNDSFNFSHWSFALQPTKTSFFFLLLLWIHTKG